MKTKYLQLIKKKWPIIIRVHEKLLWVEIANVTDSSIFIKIIYEIYKDYEMIILSQYVDTEQWRMENRSEFANELRQKYHLEVNLTTSYTNFDKAMDNISTFVLNLAGPLKSEFLDQVIGFGMTNLPNIIYNPKLMPDNWSAELPDWNNLVVKWFNLEIDSNDKQLIELIERNGPIGLTIDGHLCFCFTELKHFNKLLKIINNITQENNFSLELKMSDSR